MSAQKTAPVLAFVNPKPKQQAPASTGYPLLSSTLLNNIQRMAERDPDDLLAVAMFVSQAMARTGEGGQ